MSDGFIQNNCCAQKVGEIFRLRSALAEAERRIRLLEAEISHDSPGLLEAYHAQQAALTEAEAANLLDDFVVSQGEKILAERDSLKTALAEAERERDEARESVTVLRCLYNGITTENMPDLRARAKRAEADLAAAREALEQIVALREYPEYFEDKARTIADTYLQGHRRTEGT